MVKLEKLPKPQVLIDNEVNWTNALLGYVNTGQPIPAHIQNNYKHVDVKNCLKIETAEKCAYCESFITHVYFGDVEHIIPKSVHPELTFRWENLSLVCSWCNNLKRDYYDNDLPLLDPYNDEIDIHLISYGGLIFQANSSKLGEVTHKVIGLNRPKLVERRNEAILTLQIAIDNYIKEDNINYKEILKREILELIKPDKEFSMIKRQFLINRGII